MIRAGDEISPALAVAAVRDVFDPSALRVPGFGRARVMTTLLPLVETSTEPDGVARWSVQPSVRAEVLGRSENAEVLRWLKDGGPIVKTDRQRVFERWSRNRLDVRKAREPVAAIRAVAGWLRDATWASPPASVVLQWIARRELAEGLRHAAGPKFVGREKELHQLAMVIDGRSHRVATIEAPGGMGKSAVIAQAMIERRACLDDATVLVAALDFDAETIDPYDPSTVIASMLEQLAPQIEGLDGLRFVLEDIVAGGRTLSPDGGIAAQRIAEDSRLHAFIRDFAGTMAARREGRQLVVVLDTVERALHKAGRVVAGTIRFIYEGLIRPIEGASLVLAGRTVPSELVPDACEAITLGALDRKDAQRMLESLGVPRARAGRAAGVIDGVPLTLRLAARVLRDEGDVPLDDPGLLQAVERARINGYLYRRILAHLPDRRASALADPGLALRDLTAEALIEVLGDRVSPPVTTLEEAHQIVDGLARVEDLFLIRTGAGARSLRLRPELRGDLLTLLREADRDRLARMHERAVTHYRSTNLPAAAYHLLQLGRLDEADDLVDEIVGRELADAVGELPASSAAWLHQRMSQRMTGYASSASDNAVERAVREANELERVGRPAEALTRLVAFPTPPDDPVWYERIVRLAQRAGDADVVQNVLSSPGVPPLTAVVASEVARVRIGRALAQLALRATLNERPESPERIRALLVLSRTPWPEARDARHQLEDLRESSTVLHELAAYDLDLLRRYVAEVGGPDDVREALELGALDRVGDLDLGVVYEVVAGDSHATQIIREAEKEGYLSRGLLALVGKVPGIEHAVAMLLLQAMEHPPPPPEAAVTDRAEALEAVAAWITEKVPREDWKAFWGDMVPSRTLATAVRIDESADAVRLVLNAVDRSGRMGRFGKALLATRPDAEALTTAFALLGDRRRLK